MPNLQKLLLQSQLSVRESPGDGHCLFHCFVSSWNSEFPQEPNVSLKTFIDRSKAGLLQNLDLHLPYIDQSKFTWVHQLERYLDQKIYKLPIVDVYSIFFTNAFDVDVCVLDQIGSECVIHNFPSRRNNKSKPHYLHRINDGHFNGLKLTSGSEGDLFGKFICKMFRFRNPFHKLKEKGQYWNIAPLSIFWRISKIFR